MCRRSTTIWASTSLPTGWSKIWRSVFRWRLSRCGDSGEDDIMLPSGSTLPGHVLVVVVTDHGHLDEGGHGGREPKVTTAWAAAAGPGIRPGAPPLVARLEEVAPL